MNIQNSNNINFGARRILNVRKAVKNGTDEVVDIFVLGKEDKKFVARCNAALQENIMGDINSSAMHFKAFCRSFLSRLAGQKQKDRMGFGDMTYLVAVKNGEVITGIAEASDYYYPVSYLERLVYTQKDKLAQDGLIYGMLTELNDSLQDRGKTGLMGVGKKLSDKVDEGVLTYDDFKYVQGSIRSKNSNVRFEKVKDVNEYDLEDFLDIKDIETEIMN